MDEPVREPRVPFVFDGVVIRPAVGAPVAPPPSGQTIQGVFVYIFIDDRIAYTPNTDAYYEGLNFVQVTSADGERVWCRPANRERTMQLNARIGGGAAAAGSSASSAAVPASTAASSNSSSSRSSSSSSSSSRSSSAPSGAASAVATSSPSASAASPALLIQGASELRATAQSIGALAAPVMSSSSSASSAPAPASASAAPATRDVHIASLQAPTHQHGWQAATSGAQRIQLLNLALEAALKQWASNGADVLCVFVAPEYFFAAQSAQTYFMSAQERANLDAALTKITATLPRNVLFIPGTIGWYRRVADMPAPAPAAASSSSSSSSSASSSSAAAPAPAASAASAGPVASATPPAGGASASAPAASLSARLEASIQDLEVRHERLNSLGKKIQDAYKSDWAVEQTLARKAGDEARVVYNEALIYFNGVARSAYKLFESVQGTRDRFSNADTSTLFWHGDAPHAETYMGVRVSLEICSDFAEGAAKLFGHQPALQIVTASDYRGAEGESVGHEVLLTDSTATTLSRGGIAQGPTATSNIVPDVTLTFYERRLPRS